MFLWSRLKCIPPSLTLTRVIELYPFFRGAQNLVGNSFAMLIDLYGICLEKVPDGLFCPLRMGSSDKSVVELMLVRSLQGVHLKNQTSQPHAR